MEIGVLRERREGERRVALTPEGVAKLTKVGHHLLVEEGAGAAAGFPDPLFQEAGAIVLPRAELLERASLLVKVRPPSTIDEGEDEVGSLRPGQVLVGLLQPLLAPERMEALARRGVVAFSLDAIPRTTRAQSMDVLSSMATVSGYRAAILAAAALPRFLPLLMTAAGTIRPARVLVLGAGVAGLQAIATARRLGAVVQGFDARPAAKEQVESLGARFLTPPRAAEGEGGYARALTAEEAAEQLAYLSGPVAEADVVITTAQVPGGRAPLLVTEEMVQRMRPGSVIVDLAGESGGNCALSRPGETVEAYGVTILAPLNLPSDLPQQASELFSRNTVAFLELLLATATWDATERDALTGDDDILQATLITFGGEIVHKATRARYHSVGRS